ncbi:MAG TPA: hypothetical protein VF062_16620 [Candidatus Limnocylindrales bacterium]
MDKAEAIARVTEYILWRDLDYPTHGLDADRFEVGWTVYAPVEVDETDPMSFLDIPVGRSVFLVGDSGRIEEASSSEPPGQAEARFATQERANRSAPSLPDGMDDDVDDVDGFEWMLRRLQDEGHISGYTIEGGSPHDKAVAAEASQLIEPIVQQLALLGPPRWDKFTAELAFTVSAEIAELRFWSGGKPGNPVPVPERVADLVRDQRQVAAQMSAGPWMRLLLEVDNRGQTTVEYDYGDEPFRQGRLPDGQLLPPGHYGNDLKAYPRRHVPVWLAGYIAGTAAQGRDAQRAAAAAAADVDAGRTATATNDLFTLRDLWACWAVLAAAHVGVRSEWGPRIHPGYGWFENDRRSGSTLYLLPGDRAVLSGGLWDSELLEAAYNGGRPLPDLYAGAPAWVNDSVINTRNRNGLLTFCYWWTDGRWYRGATDTFGEILDPVPSIWTTEDTARAMAAQVGYDLERQCEALLVAATERTATPAGVAAIFANQRDADVGAAVNQLSLAGLLA